MMYNRPFKNLNHFFIFIFFSKKRPLPHLTWIKNSNNTHGFIRATVDFSVGPQPINATGYRARTLNDKRFVFIVILH